MRVVVVVLLLVAGACGGTRCATQETDRTTPKASAQVEYLIGPRIVRIRVKHPSSVQTGVPRVCDLSGDSRPELMAPLAAYVQSKLAPAASVVISGVALVDFDQDTPKAAWGAGFVAVDPRSQRGQFVFLDDHGSEMYCVDVNESDTEIILTLDHVGTIVA